MNKAIQLFTLFVATTQAIKITNADQYLETALAQSQASAESQGIFGGFRSVGNVLESAGNAIEDGANAVGEGVGEAFSGSGNEDSNADLHAP